MDGRTGCNNDEAVLHMGQVTFMFIT